MVDVPGVLRHRRRYPPAGTGLIVDHRAYYDSYWSEEGYNPPTQTVLQLARVLERHVPPGASVIDIGCGDGGTIGSWLSEHVASYVGVDPSRSGVQAAQDRGLDARIIDDAGSLPFPDDAFDAAICVEVLEHLFVPQDAVAEMCRVVRPGGLLVVTVPNVAHWRNRLDLALLGRWVGRGDALSAVEPWRDPHIRFFSRRSLGMLLRRCGLSVEVQGGYSEVGFMQTVPGLRRVARSPRPNVASDALMGLVPELAALRLFAVARVSDG